MKQILSRNTIINLTLCVVLLVFSAIAAAAQTTAFTYQGRLTDNTVPPPAAYDMQFRLFDTPTVGSGTQQGGTLTRSAVAVTNGVFTVQLDFGDTYYTASRLYLEISVRLAGGTTYTPLNPRQQMTSAPTAVQSRNATNAVNADQLGGTAANQYVQTNDSRLTDDRSPTAGSINYIQNNPSATSQDASFNIFGHGIITGAFTAFNVTANNALSGNTVSAATQFNIGNSRALTLSGGNLLVGDGGSLTGYSNTFIGNSSGANNTNGGANTFVGDGAGLLNETGVSNAFVGRQAGQSNKSGNFSSFFGSAAGANSTGDENSFLGAVSGVSNFTGNHNTLVGARANVASSNLTYAAAVGAGAVVSSSNSVVLGRAADTVRVPGALNTTGDANINGNLALSGLLNATNSTANFGLLIVDGNATVGGNLTVGYGNAPLKRILSTTSTNTLNISANNSNFFTIPVAGAQIGDSVSLGLPSNSDSRLIYNAFVSLNGTVTVRIFNVSTNTVSLSNSTVRVTIMGF